MKIELNLTKKFPFTNKTIYVSDGSCVKVKRSAFWRNCYFKKDFRLYFNQKFSSKMKEKHNYNFRIRF
jgi:hypothetical protein